MRQHIEERTVELGKYIVEKKCTVREAAKKFGISKSTVHKDVTQRPVSYTHLIQHFLFIILVIKYNI